jgi:hypothetical protein
MTTQAATWSPEQLAERTVLRRAVEAINWGMAAVNTELMFQAAYGAGAQVNQIVYWSRPLDWKNQTLTPNPDTLYLMPFFSTAEAGPIVIEIPPADDGSITGSLMDLWQVPLEDVGPAGVDKGRGGKYLVTPPGWDQPPPEGYIVLPSQTFQGYGLLRSMRAARSTTAPSAASSAWGRGSSTCSPPATRTAGRWRATRAIACTCRPTRR